MLRLTRALEAQPLDGCDSPGLRVTP
jgi:hypothetical protein